MTRYSCIILHTLHSEEGVRSAGSLFSLLFPLFSPGRSTRARDVITLKAARHANDVIDTQTTTLPRHPFDP